MYISLRIYIYIDVGRESLGRILSLEDGPKAKNEFFVRFVLLALAPWCNGLNWDKEKKMETIGIIGVIWVMSALIEVYIFGFCKKLQKGSSKPYKLPGAYGTARPSY